jgi:three-Cys-motif partner protein
MYVREDDVTKRADEVAAAAASLDTQKFFAHKKPAAVLKHAILRRYVVPFASKTGSTSRGHRVVIVDGYAGAGRYEDGEPGSPALLAEAAASPALVGRQVECYFVEPDPATFAQLCAVLDEQRAASNLTFDRREGTIEDHLEVLLAQADGVPLFLFLDPFGLGLPFDVIRDVFEKRPVNSAYPPATEVLIRFDAAAIWRTRGALHSTKINAARQRQLERLDFAAGGPWWRDEDDPELDTAAYLDWFMSKFLRAACRAAHCSGWFTEVRQRDGVLPTYYLVFLTRHRDGMEVFGEALSKAQEEWRRAVFDLALGDTDQPFLLDPDEIFAVQEKALAERWVDRLEANLRAVLAERGAFYIRREQERVFEGVLGLAREMHLRIALRRLQADGTTSSDAKGKLWGKRVVLAG